MSQQAEPALLGLPRALGHGELLLFWVRLRGRDGSGEGGIVLEDRLLELTQLVARIEPKILGEQSPPALIHLESVGLPPGAVEGEHQLRSAPLA